MNDLEGWSKLIMEDRKYPTTQQKAQDVIELIQHGQPVFHISLVMEVLPLLLKSYHVNLVEKNNEVWITLHSKQTNAGW